MRSATRACISSMVLTPGQLTVQHACIDRNMLILTAGPWDNTIRWIPPLVVTEAQINEGLNIFESALAEAVK